MAESPRDINEVTPPARKKGRRSAPVVVLTEDDQRRMDSEVLFTTKNSRAPETLKVYKSYMGFLHKWYAQNEPSLCMTDGKVDASKIRELCRTQEVLNKQAVIFKRCLMSKRHPTDLDDNNNPAPSRAGSLSGYRSAWAYYIWTENVPVSESSGIPPEWDASMQYFFKGLKNLEAARRQKGLLPSKEGKSKMSVLLFRHLADYFHAEGDVVAVFNHSWSWNLMCRSFNVAQLHAPALGWAGDCISVQYGQSKTNKGGGKRNKTAMMKHLFANPFEPMVCHLVMLTAMHIAVAHTPLSFMPLTLMPLSLMPLVMPLSLMPLAMPLHRFAR